MKNYNDDAEVNMYTIFIDGIKEKYPDDENTRSAIRLLESRRDFRIKELKGEIKNDCLVSAVIGFLLGFSID